MPLFDYANEETQIKLKEIIAQKKALDNNKDEDSPREYARDEDRPKEHFRGKNNAASRWDMKVPDFVAVDIETTGLNKANDRITEIGAVKFIEGKIAGEFTTLINPGIKIPQKITHLTGIDDETVKDAPDFGDIMGEFLEFIGRLAVCGHNVDFDISFLNSEIKRCGGSEIMNWSFDSLILSRVILELEEGYALSKVANHLHIPLKNAHRALDDALASGMIAVKLIPRIQRDVPAFSRARIANNSYGFTKKIFERTLGGYNLAPKPKYPQIMPMKELRAAKGNFKIQEPVLTRYFERRLKQAFRNYEIRPEQLEFAKIVADALDNKKICAIEAGTGTGKTVGYLVPAILSALGKSERIVISTYTKQLQSQLIEKDLPALAKSFDKEIKAAVLKGKNNYVCRRAFENIVSGSVPGISPKEKNALLPVIKWYDKTASGDIDEQNAFNRRTNKQLWDLISAHNKRCAACEYYSSCFLTKARKFALAANIVVVNHAFFYSDIVAGNEIMDNTSAIIFDEAHHLEEAGIYALQTEADNNIFAALTEGFQHVHTVLYNVTKDISAEQVLNNQEFINDVIKVKHSVHNFRKSVENFLKDAAVFLADNAAEKPSSPNAVVTLGYKDSPFETFNGLTGIYFHLGEFVDNLHLIKQKHAGKLITPDIESQISAAQNAARQLNADIKYLCEANTVGDIFWLEGPTNKKWVKLTGTTTNIKGFLNPFWKRYGKGVVFTSATLSPQKDIEYFAERVGISDMEPVLKQFASEIAKENIYFAAAKKVPDVNTPEFNVFTAESVRSLSDKFQKNILVLFTNNDNLEQVYYELTKDEASPPVFAQGISGNNAWIARQMKETKGAILLGSGSFWEGVDMPGDECEILVIPKIPFPVPTHPLQKQLVENAEASGKNGFMDYSLPQTLLRFRQGVGRLLRKSCDRGALFVLDDRIVNKNYGKFFVKLLNVEMNVFQEIEEVFPALGEFFNKGEE